MNRNELRNIFKGVVGVTVTPYDDDYEVDPNATVGKIKTAFTKSLNKKFGSRVLVDRMMNWIT